MGDDDPFSSGRKSDLGSRIGAKMAYSIYSDSFSCVFEFKGCNEAFTKK